MEGSWKRYLDATKNGAVICHESVVKNIRKISGMSAALQNRAHNFWCLSTSDLNQQTPISSRDILSDQTDKRPVWLSVTRLFPHGKVFLITPSFAVSQPARLCDFLLWFEDRAKLAPCILVACADFPGYLWKLAVDKDNESEELRKGGDILTGKLEYDKGLRRVDIDDMIRAWELMNRIIKSRQLMFDSDDEQDEDIRSLVWAPESIDQNDEQSLVNWFFWWSTTRLRCYRKFYVIGSNHRELKRAYRTVPIPHYVAEMSNNPDTVLARVARDLSIPDEASVTPAGNIANLQDPSSFPTCVFPSKMVPGDRANHFRSWLTDYDCSRRASWSTLYRIPVGWLDSGMAYRFQDPMCEYATYQQWMSFPNKFTRNKNTLLGFFYTPDTGWDAMGTALPTARHPWISIYRPVDAHSNPEQYAAMELLIWDCAAKDRFRDPPTEDQLLPMQRQLVEFTRREVSNRFPEYFLERVFVGGFVPAVTDPESFSKSPVDTTLHAIREFLDHGTSRQWLPPTEKLVLERGWKRLLPANWAAPTRPSSISAVPEEPFPESVVDEGQPSKMVFHAPRGAGNVMGRTQCTNQLYEAALAARKKHPDCRTFRYQYPATTDWYQRLITEGRDAKHIKVAPWEQIFGDLGID